MNTPLKSMLCALCQKKPCVEDSHIIPAFVLRFLKKTSLTEYLRDTGAPNRRFTDGPKPQLLCEQCEDLFSVWESKFAKEVWYPLYESDLAQRRLAYGDWLPKFAVSITWRSLIYLREQHKGVEPPHGHSGLIESALEIWREFLLGNRSDIGIHQHHMLFPSDEYDLPGSINPTFLDFYLNRAVDHSTIHSPDDAYILVKMGRVMFVGTIFTSRPTDWIRTHLQLGGGDYSPGDFQTAGCVWTFFESAFYKWMKAQGQISEHQLGKIDEAFRKRFAEE